MDVGNSNHLTISRNGIDVDLEEITFPINFPELAGGNATATQDIDFSITDRHSQQFTLTQNTTLTFSGTVADTTEYVDLLIVQDGTGGFTLTLPVGTVNAAEVEAGINLGAGDETLILLKFQFGTFYAFLQGISVAGSQTPWLSNINGAGFSLDNMPQIRDSNFQEMLIFTTTASAVNELTLVNAATVTPVQIQASGDDTDIDVQFTPKGTGTFYGNRESWGWPLTDETTAPTTGVKFTTEPAPYDMAIEDAIGGLTSAGTTAEFIIDVLKENNVNDNNFTSIFTTNLVDILATQFTSTTNGTQPNITTTTWEKGRRLQLSIDTLDTGVTARGVKIELITHATAK